MRFLVTLIVFFFFFQAEDGIRDLVRSRGLGDVYKRQLVGRADPCTAPHGLALHQVSDRVISFHPETLAIQIEEGLENLGVGKPGTKKNKGPVSYTHLRAHETVLDLVCRLLLEKKKQKTTYKEPC